MVPDSERSPSKVARLTMALFRFWPSILVALAAAAFAILSLSHPNRTLGLPFHPRRWELAVVIGFVALAGEIAGVRRQARIPALEASERKANAGLREARRALENLARVELDRISKALHYSSSERISLFARSGDCLILLARYGANPHFNQADRREYEMNAGCVGQAWANDRAHIVVTVTRDADPEEWIRQHMSCGLSRGTVQELRTGVRTVIASRVNDPRPGQIALGVIVLESTETAAAMRIPGAEPPVLDPADAANALAAHMDSLVGILSVFAELDDRAGR